MITGANCGLNVADALLFIPLYTLIVNPEYICPGINPVIVKGLVEFVESKSLKVIPSLL